MYKLVLAGMFACAVVTSMMPAPASADALDLLLVGAENTEERQVIVAVDTSVEHPSIIFEGAKKTDDKEEQKYKVQKGDTLISIAKEHEIKWQRIFDKNADIEHPDLVEPEMELVIPGDDEELESRALPEPVIVAPIATPRSSTPRASTATPRPVVTATRGASSGNRYVPGNCTWHVKSLRPDLPNNLGNANTWAARAAAQGIATGSTPRVGAAAQSRAGMHVSYVTAVNADGTVTISEMNRRNLYEVTTRTAPAGQFVYIY